MKCLNPVFNFMLEYWKHAALGLVMVGVLIIAWWIINIIL